MGERDVVLSAGAFEPPAAVEATAAGTKAARSGGEPCRHVAAVELTSARGHVAFRRGASAATLGGLIVSMENTKRACVRECGEGSPFWEQAEELERRARERERPARVVVSRRTGILGWLDRLFG
jgi:hypothetical protein